MTLLFFWILLKDASVVLSHVLFAFRLFEKINIGPAHCKVLTQVVGFSFFDHQTKQAGRVEAGLHTEIMRPGIDLKIKIISPAVYSHPFSIQGHFCLDGRTLQTFCPNDVDKPFVSRLLGNTLWSPFS